MSPVVIGNATLHLGDCMDFMAQCADKAFDLAIVDPPYGINVSHNIGRRKGNAPSKYTPVKWDSEPPKKGYFEELQRVSRHQIIWGANHFMDLIAKRSPCWIVWDKLFSSEVSFASCELAFTSFDTVTKRFSFSSARVGGIHPTQKPVELYEWLLINYTKPGQRILSTHMGSGSDAIAANNLGFEIVCCELDADYFSAACQRIENAQRQASLFDVRDAYEQAEQQASLLFGSAQALDCKAA